MWGCRSSLALRRYIQASPDSAFRELDRGMSRFWRSRSLAAVVADDFVDLDDDVFGDAGLYRSAINHLCEVDALLVRLSDRYLAEYFIFASNYDADEITRCSPRPIFSWKCCVI